MTSSLSGEFPLSAMDDDSGTDDDDDIVVPNDGIVRNLEFELSARREANVADRKKEDRS